MLIAYDITIPADTDAIDPYSEVVRLDTGTLTNIKIRFLAGCNNRVFVCVYDKLRQILPAHQTAALYGNDITFDVPMQYLLNHKPYELTIVGWSPDTRYDHVLSFWFDMIDTAAEKRTGGISNLIHLLGGS